LANKLAGIVWAINHHGEAFRKLHLRKA